MFLHAFLAMASGEITILSLHSLLLVLPFTALLAFLDIRRRHELIFINNLGFTLYTVVFVWLSVVASLEVTAAIALALIAK